MDSFELILPSIDAKNYLYNLRSFAIRFIEI